MSSSPSQCPFRGPPRFRYSLFFLSNSSPESKGSLLGVYKMTHFLTSPCYPGLQDPRPLVPRINGLVFPPSQSYCLKGLWSQPLPGTAGCKREEEGAAWRSAPGQRPSLHSEASGFAKHDFSWKQSWSRKIYWAIFCSLCVRAPAFSSKTDSDIGCCGLFCFSAYNFLIRRVTASPNKVFSIGGYRKKGENRLINCKNVPVGDFTKWDNLKGH